MPGTDGAEATRQILSWASSLQHRIQVLAVTTFDLDEYVHSMLRAGAAGFLLKDTPPDELVAAVHTVAAGGAAVSPQVLRRLLRQFGSLLPSSTGSEEEAGPDPLTARERQVLRLLARGWSNPEIAAHLYLGETTVKSHVGHILNKLGLRDRVQAVVHAYESGLVRPGEGDTVAR